MSATERAEERVRVRLERAGVFVRGADGELYGRFVREDAPEPALAFTGMDLDQQAVRAWLDGLADVCLAIVKMTALEQGGVSPGMLRSIWGGAVYQAMLFGWELAQEDPDGAA